jgi:hypothetical protein
MIRRSVPVAAIMLVVQSLAFQPALVLRAAYNTPDTQLFSESLSRRDLLSTGTLVTVGVLTGGSLVVQPEPAQAVGPVKINLLNPTYRARPCPKDKPIPGEKAMKGMKASIVG